MKSATVSASSEIDNNADSSCVYNSGLPVPIYPHSMMSITNIYGLVLKTIKLDIDFKDDYRIIWKRIRTAMNLVPKTVDGLISVGLFSGNSRLFL